MSGKFEPKEPVQLNPPNYTPISVEELGKHNGKSSHEDFLSGHLCMRVKRMFIPNKLERS